MAWTLLKGTGRNEGGSQPQNAKGWQYTNKAVFGMFSDRIGHILTWDCDNMLLIRIDQGASAGQVTLLNTLAKPCLSAARQILLVFKCNTNTKMPQIQAV